MVRSACRVLVAIGFGLAPLVAGAQGGFPSKPVRIIVPVAAGGGADFTARLVAQKLTAEWGQSVVVDNRPGAAGNLGVEIAAKAPADGYTLVLPITSFPVNPSLYAKLPFDTVKDLAPIALAGYFPLLLVVNPGVPARSVQELIALAKAKPGQLNYANSGSGTTAHLAAELLKRTADVDIVNIAYRGGGPAVIDLVAGNVQIYFSTIPAALPQVKAGRLRALAVTSAKRVAVVPDLPTVAESGLPGFEVVGWVGFFVPTGTPRPVVTRLNGEIVKILGTHDTQERLSSQGMIPGGGTPEDLGAFLKDEIAKWGKLIREAGIRIQ